MKEIKKGSTSITEYFNLVDKTAGTPKTGVAEDQIYLSYVRNRSTLVASVCATLASAVAAFSSFGAFEVDATNAPGLYRVDVPDAAFATGVDKVILTAFATSTSSVAPAMKEVTLVDNTSSDNYSLINAGVKASTVVGNVGGSVGSVVGNVGGSVGSVVGNVGGSVASVVGGVGGAVAGSVGSVSGNVGGSVGSVVGNVGGSVASVVGNVGGAVGSVTGQVVVATNNDKTGYSLSAAGLGDFFDTSTGATAGAAVAGSVVFEIVNNAGGSGLTAAAIADAVWDESASSHVSAGTFGEQLKTDVDAILVDTAEIGAAGAGLTAIPSVGSVSGNVGGSVGSVVGNVGGSVGSVVGNVGGSVASVVGNVGGTVGSVTGGVVVSTNNDKSGYLLSAIGSAALTEDYPTDGAAGTLNQMLYAILQNLGDFSITGTIRTVNKLDGSTAAMQYSLNSSTAPTAITRFS